ncbi:MAG: hypothetical protein FVQ85_02985 [Planctomycetes bacterium]|nr:hypothetical protein [Planctomycetota bacterium]
MGLEEQIELKIYDLLKRTGLLTAWKQVKDDPIKRHEVENHAMEVNIRRDEEESILLSQNGCKFCQKKYIKPKERHTLKSGVIICRRCWKQEKDITKAHPDFICRCGAYLPLPQNLNIWTKQRDGTWVCISCSQRKKYAMIKDIDMDGRIFIPVIRWKLNGHLLLVVRERARQTVKKIAAYCGWSDQYQRDLQNANQGGDKEILTISTEKKTIIDNAFVELTGKKPEEWLKMPRS